LNKYKFIYILFLFLLNKVYSQKIKLDIPELNLCQSDTLKIINNSEMAYTHYWTFCNKASSKTLPTTTVLNHYNSLLNGPAMAEPVFDGSNYYLFITNYFNKKIIKANYGNSLLNTPTITDLGNIGGVLPADLEGLEIKKEGNNWYGFVTGSNAIVRINFGTDVNNNTPTATNLGNLGQLSWPHELHIFYHDNNWIGFVANRNNNSITRLVFGNSLINTPTAYNFTNIGLTGGASGIEVKQDKNNDFFAFITDVTGKRVVRLAFGKNIPTNNNPTSTSFNNLANSQQIARGILIIKGCDNELIGYLSDEQNKIIKLEFPNDLGGSITATNLGSFSNTVGKSNDLSDIIIQNDVAYFFSTNASGNSITRFAISMCSSTPQFPSQTTQTPRNIKYMSSGKYIVNYIMNPGEANEKDTCFEIEYKENCCDVKINGKKTFCQSDTNISDTLFGVVKHNNSFLKWYKNNQLINSNSPKIAINELATYKLVVEANDLSCKDSIEFKNTLDTQIITLAPDFLICNKDTAEIFINNTNNVAWFPNKFMTDSTKLRTKVFPTSNTQYYAKSKTLAGCIFFDSLSVFKSKNTFSLTADTMICEGDSIEIGTSNQYDTYMWNTGSNSSKIVVKKPLTYILTTQDSIRCISKDSLKLQVQIKPKFHLGSDTIICNYDSLKIGTSSYIQNSKWNTGDTSHFIIIKDAGTYILEIDQLCYFSDTINIGIHPTDVLNIGEDTTICIGDTIKIESNLLARYYWWSNGSDTNYTFVFDAGTYILNAIDYNECQLTDTINVDQMLRPSVALFGDTMPCESDYTIISTVNIPVKYIWNNGSQNPELKLNNGLIIKEPTLYLLKVNNICGEAKDSITILPCAKPVFFIPNSFSPNSNNLNETFKVKGDNLKSINLQIYNRWGEKIFDKEDLEPEWNGDYKNQPCMEGIYLYLIKIKALNGKFFYLKGTFTLLR
jgi:gliding motility-associated-like protein